MGSFFAFFLFAILIIYHNSYKFVITYILTGREETFKVRRITQHSEYSYNSDTNDIAIMKLASPASFNADINRICLPHLDEVLPVGYECYISGIQAYYQNPPIF